MLVGVQVFAPAKVNIGLRVLDKKSSFEFNSDYKSAGFHCIESIFQTVSLCDEIDVSFMQTNIKNTVNVKAIDCIFDDVCFGSYKRSFNGGFHAGGINDRIL